MTIWFHQALTLVDTGTAADPRLAAALRPALGAARARRLGFLPGVATRWQNRRDPGSSAFVVELPGGALSRGGDGPPRARRPRGRRLRGGAVQVVGERLVNPPLVGGERGGLLGQRLAEDLERLDGAGLVMSAHATDIGRSPSGCERRGPRGTDALVRTVTANVPSG